MSEISNDTIVERIDGLKTIIEDRFDRNAEDHQRIEAQTTKTNGRVNKLEEYTPMLDNIRNERENKTSRIKDVFWELIKMTVVAVGILASSAVWTQYFTK